MATEEKPGLLKRIPWFNMILLSNMICAIGTAYFFWTITGHKDSGLTEAKAKQAIAESTIFKDKPIVYTLEPFTVNLGSDDERIIQIEVALEMIDEDGFEEVVTTSSHARDTIVNILNSKEYSEISSIQGKLFLKDEIIVALNEHLDQSFIKDIYFSRFMIQEL